VLIVEGVDEGADRGVGGCASIGCEKSVLCFVFVHKLMMHDAGFSSWFHQGVCRRNWIGAFPQQLNNPHGEPLMLGSSSQRPTWSKDRSKTLVMVSQRLPYGAHPVPPVALGTRICALSESPTKSMFHDFGGLKLCDASGPVGMINAGDAHQQLIISPRPTTSCEAL